MFKKNVFGKTLVTILAASTLFAGTVFAATADDAAKEEETTVAAQEDTAAKEDVEVLGTESDDAQVLELTNKTDKDIVFIDVYEYEGDDYETGLIKLIQEALIVQEFLDGVADGSFGPQSQAALKEFCKANNIEETAELSEELIKMVLGEEAKGGNMLKDGQAIKPDQVVKVFFAADAEDTESEETGKLLIPEYHVVVKYADDDDFYELNVLPEGNAQIQLFDEGGMLYIIYQLEDSDEEISTYDAESTIWNAAHGTSFSDYADYGDFGGGYDYYSVPAYDTYTYDAGAAYDAGYTGGGDGCIEDGVFN